jgi:hypothetical protein
VKRLTLLALLACLMLGGCARGLPDPRHLSAEVDYPVAHFDLQAQVAADQPDSAVRQLAARIADTEGVAVAEADYAGHTVRVAILPGPAAADTERIRGVIGRLTGVTTVAPAG